jgi:heterodisulfide reductase subunit C
MDGHLPTGNLPVKNDMTVESTAPPTRRLLVNAPSALGAEIQEAVDTCLTACYQCERCTNACPAAQFMDVKPHQVIRYAQLDRRAELLGSVTVWVCLGCKMCTTYCPNDVDVAGVINHLRQVAAPAPPPQAADLARFHRAFLDHLDQFGRVNELWLLTAYNMIPSIFKQKQRSGCLPEEARLGWRLWRQGRLHMLPRRSAAVQQIHRYLKQGKHP